MWARKPADILQNNSVSTISYWLSPSTTHSSVLYQPIVHGLYTTVTSVASTRESREPGAVITKLKPRLSIVIQL